MARAVHVTNDVTWPESDLLLADLTQFLSDMDVEPMWHSPPEAANDNAPARGIAKLEAWPRPVWIPAYLTVE